MLNVTGPQRIYLAAEPVDMRGGFDRLAGRVRSAGLDLYGGHLFVFVSKRRTHLKVLTWDGSGLVVLYKRLAETQAAAENSFAHWAPTVCAPTLSTPSPLRPSL